MSLQFDAAYYLKQNTDVANAVEAGEIASAEAHWEQFGAEEGRNPNATFNTTEYLAANTDVAESGMNPLDHFLQFGAGEGRAPNASYADVAAGFDADAYLQANQDVAGAVEAGDFESAYQHWVLFGQFEDARPVATFNGGTPVTDVIAQNEEDAGEPSELTEALTNLATAEAGVTAALASAAETVNAGEETPREGDALKDFVEQFDEDQLKQEITEAEDAIAAAEADINNETADLLGSRGTEFNDAGDADLGDGAGDAADAVVDGAEYAADADAVDSNGEDYTATFDLGIKGTDNLTDANIAKAVTEAQKAVNADKAQYYVTTDADGDVDGAELASYDGTAEEFQDDSDAAVDVVTAKGLQIAAANAESALNADVSANGTNVELLTELRTAISDFVDNGGDLSTEVAGDAAGVDLSGFGAADGASTATTIGDLLTAANFVLAKEDEAQASDAETLLDLFGEYDADTEEYEGTYALGDGTDVAGIQSVIDKLESRDELAEKSDDADNAFEGTVTGGLLAEAEALQAARDAQKDAVTEAEEALTDAQNDLAELNGAQAAYDSAVSDLEEAQQYFEDNGLELPVSLDGGVTATAENDLFLFNGEASTLAGFGLEGDDQLFIGTDFTLSAVEASVDVAGERNGDAGVLEVFAQQNGNNVELFFENETFAGNAQNGDDLTQVTLTGVSTDDLSLNADGFITIA